MGTHSFRDFDAFASTVRDVDSVMLLQNPTRRSWFIVRCGQRIPKNPSAIYSFDTGRGNSVVSCLTSNPAQGNLYLVAGNRTCRGWSGTK